MKYLLAADESAFSVAAFTHLVKIFNPAQDTLAIVYAIDHKILDDLNATFVPPMGVPQTKAIESQGARDADAVKATYEDLCLKNKIKFVWFQQDGTPIDVIKNYISNNQIETLVLGTRGRGALKRAVLGSVSTYFVQHAKVPTLVVPSGSD